MYTPAGDSGHAWDVDSLSVWLVLSLGEGLGGLVWDGSGICLVDGLAGAGGLTLWAWLAAVAGVCVVAWALVVAWVSWESSSKAGNGKDGHEELHVCELS